MANKQIMDGCTAAAYVAYALSDTATVYPITPVASMGQTAKLWAMKGRLNYAGRTMEVREMESELGAAGATHGAAAVGALATTFTASQGLLLMIPNMYKIAGELLPVVFHVGSRSLATHALSIFGDHQDVMACRATGFALLASSSVQEAMDMAAVAHIAAVRGSVPVLHFFDGWRTSNEMSTIDVIDDDTLFSLVDRDDIERQRRRGLDPARPTLRGSAQNSDVYFQNAEAANTYYNRFAAVVQDAMDSVARVTGRQYHTFDYTGAYDADRVIVIMASGAETAAETAAWLNARGEHVGVVNVRLYRPFDPDALMRAIPATVRSIAVLDRTREPGAEAEPLALDVMAAVMRSGRNIRVIHGRYGLSSKDFTPSMIKAVYDNLAAEKPLSPFTVGINDDVTHLSLAVRDNIDPLPSDVRQAIFYGMGSDGTVGATRQAASIIASRPGVYAQAYFEYSAKKSGGYTVSQLRYGTHTLHAAWSISDADIVLCNKDTYLSRFHITERLRDTGTLVINTSCGLDGLAAMMPAAMRRDIARRHIKVYTIDARRISTANGLGVRINTIMEAAFFKIADEGGFDYDITHLRDIVTATYRHEGDDIVHRNIAAIAAAEGALTPLDYPEAWAEATDEAAAADDGLLPLFVRDIARVCDARQGDTLPVSVFTPDGTMPLGSTAYEKRGIADFIPRWDPDKCVTCTLCSLVCAHAAIRPVVMTAEEAAAAPADFVSRPLKWPQAAEGMRFRIQVYPLDCTGCGSCATICPGKALTMVPATGDRDSQSRFLDYAQQHVTLKEGMVSPFTINGSQLMQPLLQFSGACGGCGETPYVKLLTQLFGPRMVIANATGCSSIWGADYPSVAYCANRDGRGPAWGNSLFEDNAEYGYGMAVAIGQRRTAARAIAEKLAATATGALGDALHGWLDGYADAAHTIALSDTLVAELRKEAATTPDAARLLEYADDLALKSVWIIGGDGWAYDIGFAGLDHVLASGENVNMLVMDTECYSNTGGQSSKATPLGAVTKYTPDGKRTYKKDLGRMMMTYGNVYVASVALGANYMQTINALREAEAYDGPSIVIAYCPCINHGIRTGMSHAVVEQRDAVRAGYWPLYRYNPANATPLTLDSAAPDGKLDAFLDNENRYVDLRMTDPRAAATLRPALARHLDVLYRALTANAAPSAPDHMA